MKLIVAYLTTVLIGLTYLLTVSLIGQLSPPFDNLKIGFTCAVTGGIGGCIYCLRAVYLNACVRQQWSEAWTPWYYIRPIVSIACGGVSYLFLRAGLLILESGSHADSTDLGFYALAFVAGLNVDKFISKIEDVAQAIWGIEKSRASSSKSNDN